MCTVVGYELLGFEEIGIEIEAPFGYDFNDIPVDKVCRKLLHRQCDSVLPLLGPDLFNLPSACRKDALDCSASVQICGAPCIEGYNALRGALHGTCGEHAVQQARKALMGCADHGGPVQAAGKQPLSAGRHREPPGRGSAAAGRRRGSAGAHERRSRRRNGLARRRHPGGCAPQRMHLNPPCCRRQAKPI